MTNKEREYFERMTAQRSMGAATLEEDYMSGVQDSVTEKYSDQAHFIYELLQNADDAKATDARFELEKDKLLFFHNGKRNFSISDPNNERRDK